MKPTIRVSIGGFAFNLEEDAYNLLNDYLQALKRHFQGNPESDEIVADIEARLSELLQMRLNGNDSVVSLEDAEEIIGIMGNPKEFGDTVAEDAASKKGGDFSSEDNSFRKKRLFRDVENKVIGGVCSGLGHYFRIDAAVIRLIFAGIFLFLFFFSMNHTPSCLIMVLIYVVLWIVMPAAKTFNQKLTMTGANPSIENIEDRNQPVTRAYRGSGVGTFFKVLLNVILGIFVVVLSATLIAMIVALIWLYFDNDILGVTNWLILIGYNTVYAKIAFILLVFIPIIGLLCLFIKLLRRSTFTTQTLVAFIIGAVVWVASFAYLGNSGGNFIYHSRVSEMTAEGFRIEVASDTLYVRLNDEYLNAEPVPNISNAFYKGEKLDERKIYILPRINVEVDTLLKDDYKIEIRKWARASNDYSAKRNAEKLRLDYIQRDSLFLLQPNWYDNEHPWKNESFEILIKTPAQKRVEIESPLNNHYWGVVF